jgi:photosystem II stability/assembly factor-like uncharacterized protein
MRVILGAAVAAWLLALAAEAHAHGCYPEANQLGFDPTTGELVLVRVTNVLILKGADGQWRWQCTEALDWRGSRQRCDTPVDTMADGTLLSASILSGVARSANGGCDWSFVDLEPDDTGLMVAIDQARHPDDPASLFVVSSRGQGQPNGVYLTGDNGESWARIGEFIDSILFETIAVAPSDANRMYLTGSIPPIGETPRQAFVYRTVDGGLDWERFEFELRENERNIYLMDVDPQDPDHLFMYVLPMQSEGELLTDFRVVRSVDGGETWADVLEVPLLGGMAFSPDGGTVWIGQDDGARREGALWRSTDGGASFEKVPGVEHLIGCVHYHDDALWICGNNWRDGFVAGRSTDGGDTFTRVMGFTDVGDIMACSEESHGFQACDKWRCDINYELFGGEPEVGDDGMLVVQCGPEGDAGVDPPDENGGGCGCAVVGTRASIRALPWLLALMSLALLALRLRHRS